ncbi:MAG: hypothetical protein ACPGN3_02055 [Opitutales bacterium]
MSRTPFNLPGLNSSSKAKEAALANQSKAWKDQCRKLEREKLSLEQLHLKQETELAELRSQVAYMRESLGQQHKLRENMAATESVEFSALRNALGESDKSNPILQSVFYLLNRRLIEMERATEEDLSNGLKLAFENGRCSAMRALKEDFLALIAEAGAEVQPKQLGETRSPFPSRNAEFLGQDAAAVAS